ncbi:MAG TPA: sigma-70 family RNA polymerase sigma factor [Planctomycetota bacterium]
MSEVVSEHVPDPGPGELLPLEPRLAASLPRLRRYLARRRRIQGEEREDVLQEVLARALRYRDRFDPRRDLWPWLRRLAERVHSDRSAAGSRHPRPLSSLERSPEEPGAPCAAGAGAETRDELARLLAPLSAVEREVLVRFHQRAQPVRVIARELALPEGTVKSHLSRARRRLAGLSEKEPPHA